LYSLRSTDIHPCYQESPSDSQNRLLSTRTTLISRPFIIVAFANFPSSFSGA
jgi:hypothetical protein